MNAPVAAVLAFVLGTALQPLVIRWMRRRGAIDVPNERSSHLRSTPRGGGLAVVTAALAGLALLTDARGPLCLPVAGYGLLGLAEDLLGVPVRLRLATQLALGALTGAVLVRHTGMPVPLAVTAVTAFTLWLTGQVNAFNFMDGVNGIAAAHAVVAGSLFSIVGVLRHVPALAGGGLVVALAALSFLPWNAGNAKIFLGDVGSYGLGAALATLAGVAALSGLPLEVAIAPMAVGLADTGWTLVRRLLAGERWYQAHRTHVYQRLTDVGWSHSRVAFATAALAAVLGSGALLALTTPSPVRLAVDAAAVALLIGYVRLPGWLRARAAVGVTR